jgi:putative two-component system response regulator
MAMISLLSVSVIAATHHEKWDGTGYPKGLAGNAIPIEGRIVAVADVFDALSSARPYKEAFPLDRCLKILADSRGKHFDPRVLDAFLRSKDEAIHVREDYIDFKQDDLL